MAATTAVSGKYKGTTSQGDRVTIKIASGQLYGSSVQWSAACTGPGATLSGTTSLIGYVRAKRYSGRRVYTATVGSGLKGTHTANFRFTVKGHNITGSFSVSAVVFAKPGQVTETCTTQRITFSAKT